MNFSSLYAKNCSIPKRDAVQYLTKYGHLLKWKNYKENILEVGCGEGSVTREILLPFLGDHIEKLEAIDKLEPMIELAKSTNYTKEIDFKTIDINDEEYIANNENKFDHIFSFYCIQLISDTRSLLNTFRKILKPDGQIFISIVKDSPIQRTYEKQLKKPFWLKYLPKKEQFADYTDKPEKYLYELLKSTGFEVNLCKFEKNNSAIVNDFKDFSKSVIHMSDVLDHLPSELRETYIQDYIKDICNECIYSEHPNRYKVLYESGILVASKRN